MSCRRAFDVDLVACLLDQGRPEWEAFRDHYPTCPECAAEVRAWTELQAELTPVHPAPERLLRFDEQPATLPENERHVIHDHVVTCAACRDELHMLRTTDLPALVRAGTAVATPAPPAPPAPPAQERPARPSLGARLRALVWHPGFAYAVAALLIIPALARYRPHETRSVSEPVASSPRRLASPERWDARPAAVDAPSAPPVAAETRAMRPQAPPTAGVARLAEEHAMADRATMVDRASKAEPAQRLPAQELADAVAPAPPWPRLEMTPASAHLLAAAVPGLVVSLPLPARAETPGPVEMRIRDRAGHRELREQHPEPPAGRIALRVPGAWLLPGHYVVELYVGDAGPVASATLDVADRTRR